MSQHRKSVHIEITEIREAAEADGFAAGINASLQWLIDHNRTDLALMMRADFAEEPAEAVAAAE